MYLWTPMSLQEQLNRRTMSARDVVSEYANNTSLTPAEKAALDEVIATAKGKRILDIGVGGGRTVKALRAISEDYLGIDYSEEMVEVCKKLYPEARFAHADARDMKDVPSGSIQLAVFSMNGLAMVGHEDRLAILREIRRVLAPGGHFLFSTYNLASSDTTRGFQFPDHHLRGTRNPVKLALRSARFAQRVAVRVMNRRRYTRHAERGPGYAIINDQSHDYATMLYYVDMKTQHDQLEDAGFDRGSVKMWERSGRATDASTTDSSITFLVRARA